MVMTVPLRSSCPDLLRPEVTESTSDRAAGVHRESEGLRAGATDAVVVSAGAVISGELVALGAAIGGADDVAAADGGLVGAADIPVGWGATASGSFVSSPRAWMINPRMISSTRTPNALPTTNRMSLLIRLRFAAGSLAGGVGIDKEPPGSVEQIDHRIVDCGLALANSGRMARNVIRSSPFGTAWSGAEPGLG